MLEQMLHSLAQGSLFSLDDLARQLETSRGTVERMLDDLVRLGYLRTIERNCDTSCAGCPNAGTCSIASSQKIWALTEKGRAAALGHATS